MAKLSRFRPCIDLHGGVVKQIVGSSIDASSDAGKTNFVSDRTPEYYAQLYAQDGLRGGHVIKLGPGNDQAALAALAAAPGRMQLGGGVNPDNARAWLDAGAAQVIVTSYVFHSGQIDFDALKRLTAVCRPEELVLDLSCRRRGGAYYVVTDLWRNFTECRLDRELLDRLSDCCCEFLIHAVDVEGKCAGPDRELLELLCDASHRPCVYAGGIRNFADIELIDRIGQGKIAYTIGSALDIFGGSLSYKEVVEHARRQDQA